MKKMLNDALKNMGFRVRDGGWSGKWTLAGCASPDAKPQAKPHEKPPHERGWIGGEFREGKAPATGTNRQAGIAVRALSPHTPASIAGLQAGRCDS